jgi:hypothetical protein
MAKGKGVKGAAPSICQHCNEWTYPLLHCLGEMSWGYLMHLICDKCHEAVGVFGVSHEKFDKLSKSIGKQAWTEDNGEGKLWIPKVATGREATKKNS